jgi:ribosomal protein S27E
LQHSEQNSAKIPRRGESERSVISNEDWGKEELASEEHLYGEPLKSQCPKCSNEFLYPQGHGKVRCPHCGEIVEVPSPQETEESKRIGMFSFFLLRA